MPQPFWTASARRGSSGAWIGTQTHSRRPPPGWRTTPPNFNCFKVLTPNWGSCWKRPGSRGSQASSWTWACLLCSCKSRSAAFLLAATSRWTCGSTRRNRGAPRPPWLNRALETELERIFREYGEEHRARRIARLVVEERRRRPFQTTRQLVKLLEQAQGPGGRRGRLHPATRVFQALRIAVNLELEELATFLTHAPAWLEPGGRLVVISYHSLEDRLVKQGMAGWERTGVMVRLTRKPLTPTAAEVQANPRARSAKLRIAEKMVH